MSQITTLKKEEYPEASALIQQVILAEKKGGWSDKGAAAVLSFLKEKLNSFRIQGIYNPDLKGVIVYEEAPYHIVILAIRKEEQRKGYGHALLQDFLEEAGYCPVNVNAAAAAVSFYAKEGFEQVQPLHEAEGLLYQSMEYLGGKELLGRKVTVEVDHPAGSLHPFLPDEVYPVNAGYVIFPETRGILDAYVLGIEEPVDVFHGYAAAMIYRKNDSARLIAAPAGMVIKKEDIINAVGFAEQYYDTRIIMTEQENKVCAEDL